MFAKKRQPVYADNKHQQARLEYTPGQISKQKSKTEGLFFCVFSQRSEAIKRYTLCFQIVHLFFQNLRYNPWYMSRKHWKHISICGASRPFPAILIVKSYPWLKDSPCLGLREKVVEKIPITQFPPGLMAHSHSLHAGKLEVLISLEKVIQC